MNNLRVDLIMESEIRSTSPVSLKLIGRLAAIILGVILIGSSGTFFVRVKAAEMRAASRREEWAQLDPRLKQVAKQDKELKRNQAILDEVMARNKARISWQDHLIDIQKVIPDNIQLRQFNAVSQVVVEKGYPCLLFDLKIEGLACGENAQSTVEKLQSDFTSAEGLRDVIRSAGVTSFEAETGAEAGSNNRIFGMSVAYKSRRYENE